MFAMMASSGKESPDKNYKEEINNQEEILSPKLKDSNT